MQFEMKWKYCSCRQQDCRWLGKKWKWMKKNRSLLWWVTLTQSRCSQRQSIRHPALLLMNAGNKSEEAGLYFAAWVTCLSRHEPMCPCIPPQLTSPRHSFTRWESLPLLSISPYSLCRSFFLFQSCVFIWFFIYLERCCCSSVCRTSVYMRLISCETQRASISVT